MTSLRLVMSIFFNSLVLSFISAQYVASLYRNIKEWRKHPHWTVSCCLSLLLPLTDLQGELRGIAETNVLKSQLQTGQIEKPSLLSAVKESGAIDLTLEEGEQDDDNNENIRDRNHQVALHKHPRRHQGTQTELRSAPVTVVWVHGPMSNSDGERL